MAADAEGAEGGPSFSDLPEEALALILVQTGLESGGSVILTCKRWHALFFQLPQLWRSFAVDLAHVKKGRLARALKARCRLLQRVAAMVEEVRVRDIASTRARGHTIIPRALAAAPRHVTSIVLGREQPYHMPAAAIKAPFTRLQPQALRFDMEGCVLPDRAGRMLGRPTSLTRLDLRVSDAWMADEDAREAELEDIEDDYAWAEAMQVGRWRRWAWARVWPAPPTHPPGATLLPHPSHQEVSLEAMWESEEQFEELTKGLVRLSRLEALSIEWDVAGDALQRLTQLRSLRRLSARMMAGGSAPPSPESFPRRLESYTYYDATDPAHFRCAAALDGGGVRQRWMEEGF
eukprot:scaffold14.g1193.t1